VAKAKNGSICAFLVATPVPGVDGYFLEDLLIAPSCPRGVGELLTLEALTALHRSGVKAASLGVVSLTTASPKSGHGLPPSITFVLLRLPALIRRFYNVDGLEVFRKRFKPQFWEEIHLALRNDPTSGISDTRAWLKALLALVTAFRPRIQWSWKLALRSLIRPLKRYPLTWGIGIFSFTLFATINHFGELPNWALGAFGFYGEAPVAQWFYRSVISDYLYFDHSHFYLWGAAYLVILNLAERTHKKRFIIPFVLGLLGNRGCSGSKVCDQ
jgi:hypothetical protein